MPFVHAFRVYPVSGKLAEMRAIAEERTKALQAAGVDAALTGSSYGPEFPYYQMSERYATLADREKSASVIGPTMAPFNARMGLLARRTGVQLLLQVLEQANLGGSPKWVLANTLAPALGKSFELRALFVEAIKAVGPDGDRQSLNVQLVGPESGVLTRQWLFDSLAEYEAFVTRVAAAGPTEFGRRRDALLSRPPSLELRQVYIPYPTG